MLLSGVVILSYLYNVVSVKTRIPSVLLLIGTGVGINYGLKSYGYSYVDVQRLVKILGAIGLIMIVLEAAMDLELHKGKFKLIRNSFLAAIFIFVLSAAGITTLLTFSLHQSLHLSLIYAIPMSIISSAIVIPSTEHLPEMKKEFIIYESSFSDIAGILVFNYLTMADMFSIRSAGVFTANFLVAIVISVLASLLLLYMLSKITIKIRFFLLFSILALVYSAGELIHTPSLLIVLIFGLVLNNNQLVISKIKWPKVTTPEMENVLNLMRSITAETSFLLRTFFFILFGYSLDVTSLFHTSVIVTGSFIVIILFICRFLYLRMILKAKLLPELFLMPRGLVTILLFYSIPATMKIENFNSGILCFVVVLTSLIMMFGLIFFHEKEEIPV